MPAVEFGLVHLAYETSGSGFHVLCIAPGGMTSARYRWRHLAWDVRAALRNRYQLVEMDQRNAGESWAPIAPTDGWSTYTQDQLGLLDVLGIDRCHVIGACIGGPYILGLLAAAPDRFAAAVIMQPVGIDGNRDVHRGLYDRWATDQAPRHPEMRADDWAALGDRMWGGEFLLSVDRDQVAACETPILVLMGDDDFHPQSVSRELAALAPNAVLVERWKDPDVHAQTDATVRDFLAAHTPSSS
jgi:pimeloyl-ACP methyl ester carboxylesterase